MPFIHPPPPPAPHHHHRLHPRGCVCAQTQRGSPVISTARRAHDAQGTRPRSQAHAGTTTRRRLGADWRNRSWMDPVCDGSVQSSSTGGGNTNTSACFVRKKIRNMKKTHLLNLSKPTQLKPGHTHTVHTQTQCCVFINKKKTYVLNRLNSSEQDIL